MEHRPPLLADLRMGVVALSVVDLARSLAFYQERLGLALLERQAATAVLGAGDLPLLRLHAGATAPVAPQTTGLFHLAIRVPTRADLGRLVGHLARTGTPLQGGADHLVSEAIYLGDPDGHGIEVYRDRPRASWPTRNGQPRIANAPLDMAGLLAEAGHARDWAGMPAGSDMGHIHLRVADVAGAEHFYVELIGLERTATWSGASFISANGYHHHIGLNSWAGRDIPPPPPGAAHLRSFELVLPAATVAVLTRRLSEAGIALTSHATGIAAQDPAANTVLITAAKTAKGDHALSPLH